VAVAIVECTEKGMIDDAPGKRGGW
jgi:hypothetical protein